MSGRVAQIKVKAPLECMAAAGCLLLLLVRCAVCGVRCGAAAAAARRGPPGVAALAAAAPA
eukprot:COSAG01_NODE_8742_length_2675_cov_8.725543_3_plen_61_part_00